ncbi:MAG: flagellar hook-basal body protein, partial [Planctomycetes bacterium]|nr:flagellar hook-basal body protein [Planctomycetota bacterium]
MNYGLYLSATGALSNMHRQDVLANNLANMNTVGFKPDHVEMRQRLPERLEAGVVDADPKWMLERLGGGHLVAPTRVDLKQGAIVPTGSDLDVAIEGDGLLVVGDASAAGRRLTRDGRLTVSTRGELVLASSGTRVLGQGQRPIRLDRDAPVQIDRDGLIRQHGSVAGQLDIVSVDARHLRKDGASLLRFADGVDPATAPTRPFRGSIIQGHIESSAVDPIITMNSMISAAKTAQANLKMMQYHDQIL